MIEPPKDVPPEVLFRRLLQLPRPTWPLERRIAGAEHIALSVRALSGAEFHEASGDPAAMTAAALLANGRRAFRGREDVLALRDAETRALMRDVMTALGHVSPVFGVSHTAAWLRVLRAGAESGSNGVAMWGLGSSFDLVGKLLVERPDRFFGVPGVELVDAHWFAFRAAKAAFLSLAA